MLGAATALALGNVFGQFWDWIAGVFARIGDVSIYWLLLALALKTAESALIGVTWRNILRASYPGSGLSFKTSWGASQGGTAINAVTPAQAGTAAMIGIFRTSIRGSTVAGVTSATVVQSLFFTGLSVFIVIAVAIFRPRTVSRGSPSDETGGFVAEHPFLVAFGALVVVVLAVALWRRMKPRLLELWRRAKAGGAILRDWRRYAREVAASSHMLSGLFAITPGGVGQTQALDVATLRAHASTDDIAAFSITQDAVMTIWNVVLGVIVMLWAFGFGAVKELLSSRGRKEEATAS